MIDLNPTVLIVTLNVNSLNTKIKRQKLPDWINFKKEKRLNYTLFTRKIL